MEPLMIPVVTLAICLAVALVIVRRRNEQIEMLRRAIRQRDEESRLAERSSPSLALGAALDALPVGVVVFDADRHITVANERAYALLGVAPGRLVGRSFMETFLDARTESLVDAIPDGGTATTDLRVGDGDVHQLSLRATRVEGGTLIVSISDITELRRLRQIRSEFIDNLSHELRTPLSTVSLLAETLAREAEIADVPPRMRDRIAKIEVETGHLVQMVSELLDLARIEGGSQLRLEDDVDLARLAESSAERLRLFAERQGVALVVDADADTGTVRGDEARLGQVLVNLVHNAVKFSPDGGEVRIEVRPVEEGAQVSVVDRGIGIPRADRARVFERFYKVDRARVRGGGTGLGLAIARHVVGGHGGRIWVESEEGEGSTFSFVVPRSPGGEPLPAQATPAALTSPT